MIVNRAIQISPIADFYKHISYRARKRVRQKKKINKTEFIHFPYLAGPPLCDGFRTVD